MKEILELENSKDETQHSFEEKKEPTKSINSSKKENGSAGSILSAKTSRTSKSERILYLSEARILKQTNPFLPKSTLKFKSPVFNGDVYVMKERTGSTAKVYHITNGSDINSLKYIESEETKRKTLENSDDLLTSLKNNASSALKT